MQGLLQPLKVFIFPPLTLFSIRFTLSLVSLWIESEKNASDLESR